MSQWWLAGVVLLVSLQTATSETEGNKHCPGYVYRLNNSLAEIRCPIGSCGLEGAKEQHQLVAWEIQLVHGNPDGYYCSKIVLRSDGSFEWHEVHHQSDVVYTADNVTATSMSICKNAVITQGIDPHSGSLILYSSIYSTYRYWYNTASAVCSVYGENCSSSQSVQITIPPTGNPVDIIHNQLSNPPLNGVAVTRYVQAKWQVGSSRYLCISALVRNPASSQWEQNGRKLSAKTVQANDLCVDCNSQRCIKQAEQLYGVHKGGRGAEVLQVTWSDPCEVNSEAIQMLSLLRVSDVSLETTGVYAFRQHFNQIQYNVAVDRLRETSFVKEPSRELTVHEGRTLQVPCVINAAVDTNLSQVYWSGPQGLITGISPTDANNRLEMACQQNDIADRVFYVKMVTNVSSDAGTLAQISLNLHVCNAEQQDSGVYRCGVWTGNGKREFKSMLLTVESTFDASNRAVAEAALSVVALALLVIFAVLVVMLCCCVCQRYERVQHLLYRMHLRSMPPMKRSNTSPGSLLPHAQAHV